MNQHGPTILIIDDETNIRRGLEKGLAREARHIDTAKDAVEGLAKFERQGYQIVITDLRLPGEVDGLEVVRRVKQQRPESLVIVITAYGTVEAAVEAMRLGAFDFVTKPVDLNVIRQQVSKAGKHQQLLVENKQLRDRLVTLGDDLDIVGNCATTQQLLQQVRQVAETDATVLIQGESGSGKELVARAIHRLSSRREAPFVAVNLGALPDTLMESELFGYEKGAFTGAARRKSGCFEESHGGTLLLDEITETAAKTQVDLLRVLEQQEVRRLGGEQSTAVDVRVISATNRDIALLVQKGEFREDLYYRLNVVPLEVPPLRQRRDDIPLLVDYFLNHFCQRHKRPIKRLASQALRHLVEFTWPGNVRQLKNLVERLVVTVESDLIDVNKLPQETRSAPVAPGGTLAATVERAERAAILAALATCNNHRERTAKMLNISVRTLHYKMNQYGLH